MARYIWKMTHSEWTTFGRDCLIASISNPQIFDNYSLVYESYIMRIRKHSKDRIMIPHELLLKTEYEVPNKKTQIMLRKSLVMILKALIVRKTIRPLWNLATREKEILGARHRRDVYFPETRQMAYSYMKGHIYANAFQ